MLFADFQKLINTPEYTISKQNDFDIINKYWNDIKDDEKNKLSKMSKKYWNKKKTKIINLNDLQILAYYLGTNYGYDNNDDDDDNDNQNSDTIKYITIAGKYIFNYSIYEDNDIRQENIFKLNFYNIVKKLKYYFPNVDIKIFFEKPTYVDKEIKKPKNTYKHDVIINIAQKIENDTNNEDEEYDIENTFEVVLEYFEKIHNRFSDEDKKISTNLFADEYFVYDENTNDINEFMKDTIYGLIQIICASTNDEYELSKILYFNKNYKNKTIKNDVSYFNKIINNKKTGKFNFEDFYNEINPICVETEEDYSQKEFIELLHSKYKIKIKIDKNDECNSEIFDEILIHTERSIVESNNLFKYKNIYLSAINTLQIASKEIIKLMKKQRTKRLQLPQFVRNIQIFHKDNLKI